MPKNTGKGGKSKRKGKGTIIQSREILKKESGQEYGQVIKISGNCRLEVLCFDGVQRLAHIRGKIQKRVWIGKDDVILVGLRDYQDTKCDVIHRYTLQEVQLLKHIGEVPARIHLETSHVSTDNPATSDIDENTSEIDETNLGIEDTSSDTEEEY